MHSTSIHFHFLPNSNTILAFKSHISNIVPLTISPINNTNDPNDRVRLSKTLITITIVMLAVTKIKTNVVIVVASSASAPIALLITARTFFNFKSNRSGNEKLAYPRISNPLQFTNASKNAALYVKATSNHGRTFDRINEGSGATPASLIRVSFANKQYTK